MCWLAQPYVERLRQSPKVIYSNKIIRSCTFQTKQLLQLGTYLHISPQLILKLTQ